MAEGIGQILRQGIDSIGDAKAGAAKAKDSLVQAMLESMDHGCFVVDDDLTILGSNRRAAEILNVDPAMMAPGRNFTDVITLCAHRGDYGPGDPEEHIKKRVASASSGKPHRFDRQLPGGVIIDARAQPMALGGMVITHTDVTRERQMEEKLRESEERFALAVSGARSGIWDWDLDTGHISFSPRIAEVLGIDVEDLGDSMEWWNSKVHPDDLRMLGPLMRDYLRGTDESWEADLRVRTASGDWCWLGLRGAALRREDGRAYRMAGSMDDITDRKKAEIELQRVAVTDPLTGAFNRRKFLDVAEGECYRAGRYGSEVAVAIFDLDHFKVVNDTYGHAVGDDCLVEFVRKVKGTVRESDLVARYGGEEFVLLMPHTGLDPAGRLTDRIREIIAEMPIETDLEAVKITVSAGVAAYRIGEKVESLMARADEALYEAKAGGRNRVEVHTGRKT